MDREFNRRDFVTGTVLASAAMALGAQASAQPPKPPATQNTLPKGKIRDLEVSRVLLGGNLLTHFTHSRDLKYVYSLAQHYNTDEKILETMATAEANGINTLSIHNPPHAMQLLKRYRKEGGKIQYIICPTAPVEPGMAKYTEEVLQLVDLGADAIYLWGVRADALTSAKQIDLIGKAVDVAKAQGVPSGVGGHELDVVVACEKNKIPADFYIKTLHHHNYPSAKLNYDSMWCKNPEETIEFMKTVEKPWIAFKTMAAGAIPPRDAIQYVFQNGADFALLGMFDYEIAEDVKIAKEVLSGIKERARPWRA
ncbi:MAG: hypothetical protein NUV77_13150 [Thermoguttaceae bacterium]|jgi:hypothetical protein|nr:hypothetical protein [Thermoguttaceae bacterium]